MIVLSKKRIMIMLSIVFISIFTFTFQIANNNKTVETVALPVTDRVIVIDAGHGIPDEGAQSSTRYNRSTNKFKNSIKITKFIRAKWINGYTNT